MVAFVTVAALVGGVFGLTPPVHAVTDLTPPTAPQNLSATSTTSTSITLSWTASTDDVGVAAYLVYRDAELVGRINASALPGYVDVGLWPRSTHTYYVVANDAAGNTSAQSPLLTAWTKADTVPPTTPTGLTGTFNRTNSTVSLTWGPSTDDVRLDHYDVWRTVSSVMTKIGAVTSTSFVDSAPVLNATDQYFVVAVDGYANISASSTSAYVSTDVTAPTAPSGLRISGSTATSASLA